MELLKDVLASRGVADDLYLTPSRVEPIDAWRRTPFPFRDDVPLLAFDFHRNGRTEIYWRFEMDVHRDGQILRGFARHEFFLDPAIYELTLPHDEPTIDYFHVVGGGPIWS